MSALSGSCDGYSLKPPFLCIVMEMCTGSLHGLLHEMPYIALTPAQRQRLAQQAAQGVAHLHLHALVHRDLKSPNFLYMHNAETGAYNALLADFGEVITVEFLEGGGDSQEGLIGTPNWAAPEILTFPRRYSQQSDVFALALVVFECLAGEALGGEFLKRHLLDGQYFDFSQFTMKGSRPSLEKIEPSYGAGVCMALGRAWAQDPAARGPASGLAEGLEGGEMLQQEGTTITDALIEEGRVSTMGDTVMKAAAAASHSEEAAGQEDPRIRRPSPPRSRAPGGPAPSLLLPPSPHSPCVGQNVGLELRAHESKHMAVNNAPNMPLDANN